MALTVCSICKQHIVQGTSCVHCTPSSTATLAVPLALLLGLGCQQSTSNGTIGTDSVPELSVEEKSDEAPEVEIEVIKHMQALYGVPNVPNFILEPTLEESKESKESKEDNAPEDKEGVEGVEGVDDDESD
mgnify:CR=1 FL=1